MQSPRVHQVLEVNDTYVVVYENESAIQNACAPISRYSNSFIPSRYR